MTDGGRPTRNRTTRLRLRMRRRRRRAALLGVLLLMAGVGVYFAIDAADPLDSQPQAIQSERPLSRSTAQPDPTTAAAEFEPEPEPTETVEPEPPLLYSGDGTFTYASARNGEVWGEAGTLLRYNVAVEDGLGIDVEAFSDAVAATMADERGWIAGRAWRFEQVGQGSADFTIWLASPQQRAPLCGSSNTTVSCRNGDNVVVNSARWVAGVPHWDGTLDEYRQYVVNHEVGHRLGHGHVVCPEEGEPSPVMAQQTFQLAGCTGNAWPYPDGRTFIDGPMGEYGGPALPPDPFEDR